MKYRIIANPTAGKGHAAILIPQVSAELQKHGLDFQIVQTQHPGHGYDLAIQGIREGAEVIVGAGGDGTMNEILNGLVSAREQGMPEVIMGAVPIGRGNDFSFGMGIPLELTSACQALANARTRRVDLGRVTGGLFPDGKIFGNGVGIGFDTKVGFEANRMNHLRGFLPYLLGALKTLFAYNTAPQLKVELDSEVITLPALMVSIMNGKRMGGAFHMAPKSHSDDGLFDLCIANHVSRPEILRLIGRFMKGDQESHPAIQFKRSSKVTITALEGSIPCHADGETICEEGQSVMVEILPQYLSLIY